MATSTHRIDLTNEVYVNISNGNLNCSIGLGKNQYIRLVIGGTEPLTDTPDHVPVSGPQSSGEPDYGFVSVTNLAAEDDVWARAEADPATIHVIRGPAILTR